MTHRTEGLPGDHRSPAAGNADPARCDATLWLHGPLERSLAGAVGGPPIPPLQRCALPPGHRGRHHALADAHGARRCWFHWDENGFRVGVATTPTPRDERHFHLAKASRQRPPSAEAVESDPPTIPCAVVPNPTRDQAIWALAAAVKRLGDVIADAAVSPNLRSVFTGHEARTDGD
jgi:hypothetical protein